MLFTVVIQWVLGYVVGIYRHRWVTGSFDELLPIAGTVASVTALLVVVDLVVGDPRPIPLSAAVAAGFLAFVFMGGARYLWRHRATRRRRPQDAGRERVLVFGAGDGGDRALQAMLNDPDSPYVPVALLDDDPRKLGLSLRGVRVVGDRTEFVEAAERFGATVGPDRRCPAADSALIRELVALAQDAGLEVRVLPSVRELLGGEVRMVDIREPDDVDLLGRPRIETDVVAASGYLSGRVVAVTGAGGSIGSELCRQIWPFGPARLIMIDRDESALHAVQMSLEGRALLDSEDLVLLDIRDRDRVRVALRRAPARRRVPRRRAQAPDPARVAPGGGAQDQRVGHPRGARRRRGGGRTALREHLDRQGGEPLQRSRLLEARL